MHPILLLLLGFLLGFLVRRSMKYFFPQTIRGSSKNIKYTGRIMRAIAGIALCIYAYLVPGRDLVYIGAGFCFFQAIFSRCGFYAAIGKSECPL